MHGYLNVRLGVWNLVSPMQHWFVVIDWFTILCDTENKRKLDRSFIQLRHDLVLRRYKEKHLFFLSTTSWQKVVFKPSRLVLRESQSDELCALGQIALRWTICGLLQEPVYKRRDPSARRQLLARQGALQFRYSQQKSRALTRGVWTHLYSTLSRRVWTFFEWIHPPPLISEWSVTLSLLS